MSSDTDPIDEAAEHGDTGTSLSSRISTSRRAIMQAAAATGAAAALGGVSVGSASEHADTFELDGFTAGWEGVTPDEIAGETNPTLELEVGETYVVEFTNADGVPHDFAVLDAEGNELESTEIITGEGETATLEFEATEEMAEYYCSVHPAEMRGSIDLVGVEDQPEPEGVTLVEPGPTIGLETVAEGLTSPVDLTQPEGDDRRFIVDQPGQIFVHDDDGLRDEPFLDVSERMPELGLGNGEGFDERGLLGLAFHPDFAENGRFFVRYSGERGTVTPASWSHTFVVSEFHADDDAETVDLETERRVMEIPQPQFNHNAGPLEFGPDGYLYIAVGDGGSGDDTGPGHVQDWYDENEGGNGQNVTDTMLGGMLRIDVDGEEGGKPYAIPDDNPFADPGEEGAEEESEDENGAEENGDDLAVPDIEGIAEYYAWGMRNPWGMSFTQDGELLAADVGQLLFEIINHVRRAGNYGWNVKEGTHCFDTENPGQPPEDCPDEVPEEIGGGEPLIDPVIEYPQEYGVQNLGSAIVGGDVYHGDHEELQGAYIFGDWSQQFAEPLGRLYVSYPPEGWPEDPDAVPEESLADQAGDQSLFQEERWEEVWPMAELVVDADGDLLRNGDGMDDVDEDEGVEDDERDDVVEEEEDENGVDDENDVEDEQAAEDEDVDEEEPDIDRLSRFVLAIEPDAEDNLYVLTSGRNEPFGDTGQVHRITAPEGNDT